MKIEGKERGRSAGLKARTTTERETYAITRPESQSGFIGKQTDGKTPQKGEMNFTGF